MALTLILVIKVVSADRGFILPPHIYVREDSQVAIIAWDGVKEILMLSTNVRSNEPAEIWEVIPLPSEPLVEKGDEESFRKITLLYNEKIVVSRKMGGELATTKAGKGVEVIFRKQIGVHNLTVVRAENVKELEEWVRENLNLSVPAKAFERYISKSYNYFVFDKICVGPEEKTVESLIYIFKTDEAYYPLVITTETTKAPSSVSLFLVTKGKSLDGTALSKWSTVFFSGEELKEVHEILYGMFPSGAYVTYYRDFGTYSEDFVVRNVYVPTVLDLALEWLNERFFVQVLKQYFSGSWWRLADPMVKVISLGIVLTSLAGLVTYGYFTYAVARRRFGRVFGILAVVVFYALTVCVNVFGLFVLATSLPIGVGAYALLVIEVCRKLKAQNSHE